MTNNFEGTFAFETWHNGGLQMSAFYEGIHAINFIYMHEQSRTFADLHVYHNKIEALTAYEQLQSEVN
jgi:hypothetical protein